MSKLEQARKTWVGKSDEWLYERLANELSDKVQEIHRLIKELDEVKNLTISDVIEQSEQLVCEHPDEAIIRDKPTDYCLACNRNI